MSVSSSVAVSSALSVLLLTVPAQAVTYTAKLFAPLGIKESYACGASGGIQAGSGKAEFDFVVQELNGPPISSQSWVNVRANLDGSFVFDASVRVHRTITEGNSTYDYIALERRLFSSDGNSYQSIESPDIDYRYVGELEKVRDNQVYFDQSVGSGLLKWDGQSLSQIDLPFQLQPGLVMTETLVPVADNLLLRVQDQRRPSKDIIVGIDGDNAHVIGEFPVNSLGDIFSLGDSALFSSGGSLFRTDGNDMIAIGAINPIKAAHAQNFVRLGDETLFIATGPQGWELYKSDGSSVEQVADINPNGDALTELSSNGVFNDRLYFSAESATGAQLYRTDGTVVEQLTSFSPVTGPLNMWPAVSSTEHLYFRGVANDREILLATDGLTINTIDVPDEYSAIGAIAPVRDRLLFTTWDSELNGSVWSTDGTSATLLANLFAVGSTSLLTFNDQVVFSGSEAAHSAIYISDGLSVTQIQGTSDLSFVGERGVNLSGTLFFRAGNELGTALYATNGVAAKTVDLGLPGVEQVTDPFEAAGGVFVFANAGGEWHLLRVSAIPEPATLLLVAVAIGCCVLRRGRGAY